LHADLLSSVELGSMALCIVADGCNRLKKTNKEEEEVGGRSPTLGVNHVYPMLMCFVQFCLCCLYVYLLSELIFICVRYMYGCLVW
jgi:hypothetical protein